MSDKAKPLTPEERERCVQFAKALGDTDNLTEQHAVERLLRWDATLRQLEQCLVAVTAERDKEWNACGVAQAALAKAETELDQQKLLVEALMSDPDETDRWDLSGRLHDAWEEIHFHDADLAEVARERECQDAKWGEGHDAEHDFPEWLGILYTELLEVQEATGPEYSITNEARVELVHLASVAIAALQHCGVPVQIEGG